MKKVNLSPHPVSESNSPNWEPLVSSKTIREKLGLGESAFHALLSRGLPHYQLNRRLLRFRLSTVQAWLEDRRRGELLD